MPILPGGFAEGIDGRVTLADLKPIESGLIGFAGLGIGRFARLGSIGFGKFCSTEEGC